MFFGHAPELIIVLVVALLIFGPKRLPEMGAGVGKFIKEFRKGVNEISHPTEEKTYEVKSPGIEAIEREKASYVVQKSTSTPADEMVVKASSSETSGTGVKID